MLPSMPLPQMSSSPNIQAPAIPMAAPMPLPQPQMMATSDRRAKFNVCRSEKELDDLLNRVYENVLARRNQ